MPYVKKSDLKLMLRDAFGTGFWNALAIDHEEASLHIQQHEDFEKFYESFLKKNLKSDTTK